MYPPQYKKIEFYIFPRRPKPVNPAIHVWYRSYNIVHIVLYGTYGTYPIVPVQGLFWDGQNSSSMFNTTFKTEKQSSNTKNSKKFVPNYISSYGRYIAIK